MALPSPTSRTGWRPATILGIVRQTPHVLSFFYDDGTDGAQVAGQHVDIRLTAPDGYQAERSYSIASVPGDPLVELVIERVDDGEVSAWFHEVAAPGDVFEVRGPIGGHFIWRASDDGPLLLLAGGSGIAPLMAMLRERRASGSHVPTLLLYSARTWNDVIFRDELLRMETANPALVLRFAITRGPVGREQDIPMRLDTTSLRRMLDDWGETPQHVFVCGANRFVESVTQGLLANDIPAPLIRTERFGGSA